MLKLILALSVCVLAACAKDVTKTASPMGDNGTPVSNDNQEYTSHALAVFANHATTTDVTDIYSLYKVSEHIEILVPTQVYNTSYTSTHPTLVLTLNGSTICQYSWVLNKYQASSSCPETLDLPVNSSLSLLNIPRGQTSSLNIYYKKVN